MDKEIFKSVIHDIIHHSDDIFELKISSPLAAKNYLPGQFFKLQNFQNNGEKSFEPIAITASSIETNIIPNFRLNQTSGFKDEARGAYINIGEHDEICKNHSDHLKMKNGIISSIIQIVGKSTKAASHLKKGQEITLIGPCGQPSYAPSNSSFLLIGGGVGVYALLPYAKLLKENNNKISILAGYRKKEHCIYKDQIKEYADQVFFTCDEGEISSENIITIPGNIIDGLNKLDLRDYQNIFIVGSSSMMHAVAEHLESNKMANKIASINAPMQCMFGGVCGQCLTLVPSDSGDKLIFICKHQDQNLEPKLMSNLRKKLCQNSLLEKI